MKHGLPAGSPKATHPIGKQKSETRENFTSHSDVFEPVYGAWGGRAYVLHSGKKEKLKGGLEPLKVHPVPTLYSWSEQMASHSWNSSVSAGVPLPVEALVAPEVTTPGGQGQLLYFFTP